MTIDNTVDPCDPRLLFQALGDPREYDRFEPTKLKENDYAVVVNANPGAIYFCRTRNGQEPREIFDGEVIMTHLLLGSNAEKGEAILRHLARGYQVERREGRDQDGVSDVFFVLKKETA